MQVNYRFNLAWQIENLIFALVLFVLQNDLAGNIGKIFKLLWKTHENLGNF
jgi:hypothetical protein